MSAAAGETSGAAGGTSGPAAGTFGPARAFSYLGWEVDPDAGALVCRYDLDGQRFSERIVVHAEPAAWSSPAAAEAARLVFLLAGVSYYKAGAPPVVDLGPTPLRHGDLDLLRAWYRDGLGELAHRNGLDLGGLRFEGGTEAGPPAGWEPPGERPLVPFGGGIDSIVTVEGLRERGPAGGVSLFVLSREGDRFAAIEEAAAATGLPVARAERALDPEILRSGERGWINGHVPVTGIVSAIALLSAVLRGHDSVVMSNERSASSGNLDLPDGRSVNHQWSKGWDLEELLRAHLARSFVPAPGYFSWLRPWSELWVARRFAGLGRYLGSFRSCNRAFALDPARRLDHWCGHCDKCCFIDLVLAPFVPAGELARVWGGHEPLCDPSLAPTFRTLLGTSGATKPWECVGDVSECRAALRLAASRPDRAGSPLLAELVAEVAGEVGVAGAAEVAGGAGAAGSAEVAGATGVAGAAGVALAVETGSGPAVDASWLMRPHGPHAVPERYAPSDLLD